MITVRLFASLRDAAGQPVVSLPGPAAGDTSPGEIFAQLTEEYPRLAGFRDRVRVAVNETYADWEASVSDGDQVAFFPPVSGG